MGRTIPNSIFLALLLFSPVAFGEVSNQFLGDQIPGDEGRYQLETKKFKDTSPFLNIDDQEKPEGTHKEGVSEVSGKGIKNFDQRVMGGEETPDIDSQVNIRDKVKSPGGHILGEYENQENLVDHADEKTFKEFKKEGRTNFSFIFSKDTYNYKDSNNAFEQTFRKSKDSSFPGALRISWQKFYLQGLLGRLGMGLGTGFGHNGGKGIFVDGQTSEYNFSLWTIPLDWIFVYELPVVPLFKVGAAAGPSLLLLMQNRTDLEYGDKKKSVEQWGRGYFAELFFRLNLVSLFSINHYVLYQKYSVTDFYLTLNMRSQHYSHFKSRDISVTGSSFGAGLTFEIF